MIDGINDTPADAAALVALLRGSGAHVNCIPLNQVAHTPWQPSAPQRIAAFVARLRGAGIGVTVRRNRGHEVGAACGQLAAAQAGEPPPAAVSRRRELLLAASTEALLAARGLAAPSGDFLSPDGPVRTASSGRQQSPGGRTAPPRPRR
jgi:hypothetical protein